VATPNGRLTEFGSEPGVYVADLDREEVAYARRRRRYLEDAASMPEVHLNTYGI
jgi:predicted amidohydrolase